MKINWSQIKQLLKVDISWIGLSGYDVLKLLKALLLQAWCCLSDVDLEKSPKGLLDFSEIHRIEWRCSRCEDVVRLLHTVRLSKSAKKNYWKARSAFGVHEQVWGNFMKPILKKVLLCSAFMPIPQSVDIHNSGLKKILSNINKQLEVGEKGSAGAILDATMIEPAERPQKTL